MKVKLKFYGGPWDGKELDWDVVCSKMSIRVKNEEEWEYREAEKKRTIHMKGRRKKRVIPPLDV
jgi:hypothetical protein